MIKFFRHIRKKLLSENKFSKYLLYAIGEIVLVVIGILIALQINNRNEYRKDIAQKNQYCKQLIASLNTDLTTLKNFRERLVKLEAKGVYLWEVVNEVQTTIDTNLFKNNFLNAASAFDFTPKATAYENLVANNGLSLINSDSLKTLLALYFVPQKGADEVFKQRIEYAASYNDLRFEFASPMMLKKYLNTIFENEHELTALGVDQDDWDVQIVKEVDLSEFPIDWDKLKKSQEFKTYLGRMLAIREPQLYTINRTEKILHELIVLLNKEIQ